MNLDDLSQVFPMGGATVCLVYLLKVLISDRRSDRIERARMRKEHIEDMERMEAYWRKRCAEAERRAFGITEEDDPHGK